MAENRTNPESMPQSAHDLPHRPDPNHVRSLQTIRPGEFAPAPAPNPASRPSAAARRRSRRRSAIEIRRSRRTLMCRCSSRRSGHGRSRRTFTLAECPPAHLLSRMAQRFGERQLNDLAKAGSFVALPALLPCPPLLIKDLGDPKRFHHMLRFWKPGSPMNLGTWAITAYGGTATAEAIRHYLASHQKTISGQERSRLLRLMNNGVVLAAHDAAGVPLALVVASYTGVLLSCTANPLWCKNPWLAPMFAASAISTGAEAISLALDWNGTSHGESTAQRVLKMLIPWHTPPRESPSGALCVLPAKKQRRLCAAAQPNITISASERSWQPRS